MFGFCPFKDNNKKQKRTAAGVFSSRFLAPGQAKPSKAKAIVAAGVWAGFEMARPLLLTCPTLSPARDIRFAAMRQPGTAPSFLGLSLSLRRLPLHPDRVVRPWFLLADVREDEGRDTRSRRPEKALLGPGPKEGETSARGGNE
jgi:hypothetical protein